MTVLTQYSPAFPPGDTSTATPGDDAIDVGRIILNPNWARNREEPHQRLVTAEKKNDLRVTRSE